MRAARAFTLIEVVISVAIVGLLLACLAALIGTVPLTRTTHDSDVALSIANDQIEALRAGGYDALPASGSFTHTLLASLPGGSASRTISTYNAKTKQVTVTVSWQEPGQTARNVVLSTLVTQVGGLP